MVLLGASLVGLAVAAILLLTGREVSATTRLPFGTLLAVASLPGDEATEVLTGALDDPDPEVRRRAALAAGRRGVTAAVPVLVGMVAEGTNDVEASEVLGTLSADPARGERILAALAGELTADTAVRIRLAQALAELPGSGPRDLLHRLAGDDDPTVALVASALAEARPAD